MRLILTRHAKSSWDDPSTEDHDRPLNARGQRAAVELGDWLASRGYEPEEVLCSTATRTQQTWERLRAAPLEVTPEVRFLPELYHASPEKMLKALHTATANTVLILGHNPGIASFATSLPSNGLGDPNFARYPTAATLVADFDIDTWSQAQPGQADIRDTFTPSR